MIYTTRVVQPLQPRSAFLKKKKKTCGSHALNARTPYVFYRKMHYETAKVAQPRLRIESLFRQRPETEFKIRADCKICGSKLYFVYFKSIRRNM